MDKTNRNLLILNGLLLVFCMGLLLTHGCGGGGGSTDPAPVTSPGLTKVKASNVIFRDRAQVYAKEAISEEKVYADNVVLDKEGTTLNSDNVQDAFEETEPKLSDILVGTWDIVNYGTAETTECEVSTGTITFNEDGTFTGAGDTYMFGTSLDQTYPVKPSSYKVVKGFILETHWIDYCPWAYDYTAVKSFTKVTKNKIINARNGWVRIATKREE